MRAMASIFGKQAMCTEANGSQIKCTERAASTIVMVISTTDSFQKVEPMDSVFNLQPVDQDTRDSGSTTKSMVRAKNHGSIMEYLPVALSILAPTFVESKTATVFGYGRTAVPTRVTG